METVYFKKDKINEAAEYIKEGKLVAFPTETVYGLGADATNELAVRNVYAAKGRPSDNPLIVHVTSPEEVKKYVDNFSENAQKLTDKFWPGPLTLIFPVKKGCFPAVVTGNLSTVAFRMPNNDLTLELIHKSGVPLVGPSANTSGKPSPTTAKHVYHDLQGKISGIVDGGKTVIGLESTVLDISDEIPVILRPGAITKEELENEIGTVELDRHILEEGEQPKSPGMKYKHYAPNVTVSMIDYTKENWQEAIVWAKEKNLRIGLLASEKIIKDNIEEIQDHFLLTKNGLVKEAMQNLFEGLRYLDDSSEDLDIIFVQTFSEMSLGVAYMNRLKKAANQNFF